MRKKKRALPAPEAFARLGPLSSSFLLFFGENLRRDSAVGQPER